MIRTQFYTVRETAVDTRDTTEMRDFSHMAQA